MVVLMPVFGDVTLWFDGCGDVPVFGNLFVVLMVSGVGTAGAVYLFF